MEGLSLNECALILCIIGALRNGKDFSHPWKKVFII